MRHGCLGCLFAWFLMQVASTAVAEKLLVVGTPEVPFKMEQGGEIVGIDVEIMTALMDALKLEYEFRLIDSGSRIIREAQLGAVDIVLSFSKTAEREEYLAYPAVSYKTLSWNFFIRAEDQKRIQFDRLEALKGLRVGAVRDWSYSPEFWQAGLNLQLVTNHRLLLNMLLNGRIDTAPLNTLEARYLIYQQKRAGQLVYLPTPLVSRPYFNVFVKTSKKLELARLRESYDTLINKMTEEGHIRRIFANYLGDDTPANALP